MLFFQQKKVILRGLMFVWFFICLLLVNSNLWSFDLIQITNTTTDEKNHSIAVKNKSIYLAWETAFTIYFIKSKDGGSNWSTPIEIGKGIQPSIAVGENSLVYIVWSRSYNDTVFSIYSENDGESFPENGKRGIGYGDCPAVSIDNKNRIHVVWFLRHNNPFYVRALHPDSAFSSPVAVDTAYYKWAESMDIVTDDEAQKICVAWSGPSPHYIRVNMAVSRDSGASFKKIPNPTGSAFGEYNLDLALFSNDDVCLVWEPDYGHWYYVRFRKFEDWGQKPGPLIGLNERPAGWRASRSPIFYPSIAVDYKNNIYAVWVQPRYGYKDSTDIYFAKSIDGGQSFGTEIFFDISPEPSSKRNSSIAITDSDTIRILWEDNRDGDYDIYLGHIPLNLNYNYKFPQQGWYLISLPVFPSDNELSTLFPTAISAFGYDSNTGSYYSANELDPQKGYWLLIPSATSVTISGIPMMSYTKHYSKGWYLISSVYKTANLTDPDDNPDGSVIGAYGWDLKTKKYYQVYPSPPGTGKLEPGESYWLAVSQSCDLTIGGGTATITKTAYKGDSETFRKQFGSQPPPPPPFISDNSIDQLLPITEMTAHNYPNPFNPETVIEYTLPKAGLTRLAIYNALGQRIRTLLEKEQEQGIYKAIWDGRDDKGNLVPTGIYLYRIMNSGRVETRKILLLK